MWERTCSGSPLTLTRRFCMQGLKDTMAGGKTLLTEQEAQSVLTEMQAEARKKQEEKMKLAGEANKKEGDAFLAANKTKEGVVTLPSGLQYKIIKARDWAEAHSDRLGRVQLPRHAD